MWVVLRPSLLSLMQNYEYFAVCFQMAAMGLEPPVYISRYVHSRAIKPSAYRRSSTFVILFVFSSVLIGLPAACVDSSVKAYVFSSATFRYTRIPVASSTRISSFVDMVKPERVAVTGPSLITARTGRAEEF